MATAEQGRAAALAVPLPRPGPMTSGVRRRATWRRSPRTSAVTFAGLAPSPVETSMVAADKQGMRQRLALLHRADAWTCLPGLCRQGLPTSEWMLHERSAAWVGLSVAILLGILRSRRPFHAQARGAMAAVTAGGALGNLISVWWIRRVPEPVAGDRTASCSTSRDARLTGGLVVLVVALIAASVWEASIDYFRPAAGQRLADIR